MEKVVDVANKRTAGDQTAKDKLAWQLDALQTQLER